MKKLVYALLLITVLITFSACGGSDDEESNMISAVKVNRKWMKKQASKLAEELTTEMKDGRMYTLSYRDYESALRTAGVADIEFDEKKDIMVLELSEKMLRRKYLEAFEDTKELPEEYYERMRALVYASAPMSLTMATGENRLEPVNERIVLCSASRTGCSYATVEKSGETEYWLLPTNCDNAYISVAFEYSGDHVIQLTASLVLLAKDLSLEEAAECIDFELKKLSEE
ncbi:MAG: hypothetical protein MJ064_06825 [Lachnospiraceae bacterium]|nr:hypothetical protein [Lachnospiraceae bacterium]